MRYFDLHCDTATEIFADKTALHNNGKDIDLSKLGAIEKYTQLFAVFIPDEMRGKAAVDYYDNVSAYLKKEIASCPEAEFYGNGNAPVSVVLSVEGGSACGGDIEGIYHLRDTGTAVVTLTWNKENEIACGCFSDEDNGIFPFGREALLAMKDCGIVPDVSHLGKKSFADLADFYDGVFIATHSNLDLTENIWGKTRNLSLWQVKEIVDRQGLIGVNFCADFLGDNGDTGFNAVLRNIYGLLEAGAENVLALGSDYDGCTVNSELKGIDKVPMLYEFLGNNGIDGKTLDKIFYENADKFFSDRLSGLYEAY